MGLELDAIRAARNYTALAPLDEREHILLDIALRSVSEPEGVNHTDMEMARVKGWIDREIFDAVAQAANIWAFNHLLRTFNIEQQAVYA